MSGLVGHPFFKSTGMDPSSAGAGLSDDKSRKQSRWEDPFDLAASTGKPQQSWKFASFLSPRCEQPIGVRPGL